MSSLSFSHVSVLLGYRVLIGVSSSFLLHIMVLEARQLQFVQHQLRYHFKDVNRLVPCFKAAHRDAHDEGSDDGNRALAQLGVTIMEMIEKRCSSIVRTEPRCKIGQATACSRIKSLTRSRCRSTEGGMGEQQREARNCVR